MTTKHNYTEKPIAGTDFRLATWTDEGGTRCTFQVQRPPFGTTRPRKIELSLSDDELTLLADAFDGKTDAARAGDAEALLLQLGGAVMVTAAIARKIVNSGIATLAPVVAEEPTP